MFPVAPEGRIFVLGTAWVTVITLLFGHTLAGMILLGLAFFLLLVFRRWSPRAVPREPGMVAPADGVVESILEDPDPFAGTPAQVVCIRQRWGGEGQLHAPVGGKLVKRSGSGAANDALADSRWSGQSGFLWADDSGNSYTLIVENRGWPRLVRIAPATGTRQGRGDRLGFAGFGQRIRLWMPAEAVPACSPGDRVRAGVSVLATLPPSTGGDA